jgi:hypothetical protein
VIQDVICGDIIVVDMREDRRNADAEVREWRMADVDPPDASFQKCGVQLQAGLGGYAR